MLVLRSIKFESVIPIQRSQLEHTKPGNDLGFLWLASLADESHFHPDKPGAKKVTMAIVSLFSRGGASPPIPAPDRLLPSESSGDGKKTMAKNPSRRRVERRVLKEVSQRVMITPRQAL